VLEACGLGFRIEGDRSRVNSSGLEVWCFVLCAWGSKFSNKDLAFEVCDLGLGVEG